MRRLPLLDRRGAEHIKKYREATTECEAGWWIKIDEHVLELEPPPRLRR
jgi:hypothetical protein